MLQTMTLKRKKIFKSRRWKQQRRPSNFPLSLHILEGFLNNPPPGFNEKAKKKIVKTYLKYTQPSSSSFLKDKQENPPAGVYFDDD